MKKGMFFLVGGLQLTSVVVGILLVVFGDKICMTENCTSLARYMESKLNREVDPCDDFYAFACGGVLTNRTDNESMFANLRQAVLREGMFRVLTVLRESPKQRDPAAIKQIKEFYKKCTSEYFNLLRAQRLYSLFRVLGGFPTVEGHRWKKETWSWVDTARKAWQMGLRTDCFFTLKLMPNFNDASKLTYSVALPVFPSRAMPFQQLSYWLSLFRPKTADTRGDELMMNNLEVEINIMAQKTPSELEHQYLPSQMKLSEVKTTYGFIDWEQVINIVEQSNETLPADLEVIIENPDYLSNLQILYETLSNETLANYIMWGYLGQLRAYLAVNKEMSLYFCYDLLKESMPIALQAIYLDKWPDTSYKDYVTDMTLKIKRELAISVDNSDWMDLETKTIALYKIENILLRIGYPKELLNSSFIDNRYEQVNLSSDFLNTIIQIKKGFLNKYYNLRFKKLDRSFIKSLYLYTTPIYSARAFYDETDNSMNILHGILVPPFFNLKWPQCVIYGELGTLLGRELVRAVDSTGRFYGPGGMRMLNWWSSKTQNEYKEKAECFINQFGNFTFFDNLLRGDLELEENAADSAGVRLSFLAYKKLPTSFFHPDLGLPVLNLTPRQLFFLTFAQSHCHQYRDEEVVSVLESKFAPEGFRVIGSLQNTRYFSHAFGCELGTNMNRKKKCMFW